MKFVVYRISFQELLCEVFQFFHFILVYLYLNVSLQFLLWFVYNTFFFFSMLKDDSHSQRILEDLLSLLVPCWLARITSIDNLLEVLLFSLKFPFVLHFTANKTIG